MIKNYKKISQFLFLFSLPILCIDASAQPEIIYGSDHFAEPNSTLPENTTSNENIEIPYQQSNLTETKVLIPQNLTLIQNQTTFSNETINPAHGQINTTETGNPGLIVDVSPTSNSVKPSNTWEQGNPGLIVEVAPSPAVKINENKKTSPAAFPVKSDNHGKNISAAPEKMKLSDFFAAVPERKFESFKTTDLSFSGFFIKATALRNFIRLNRDTYRLLSLLEIEKAETLTSDEKQRVYRSLVSSPTTTQAIKDLTDAGILNPRYYHELQKFGLYPQTDKRFVYKAPRIKPQRYFKKSPLSSNNRVTNPTDGSELLRDKNSPSGGNFMPLPPGVGNNTAPKKDPLRNTTDPDYSE